MPMEADKQDSMTEPNPLQNVFVRFHTPEGDCMDESKNMEWHQNTLVGGI